MDMAYFAQRATSRSNRRRRAIKWIVFGVALFAPLQCLRSAGADEGKPDAPKAPDPAIVQQLVLEVQELRARVTDLEAKLAAGGEPSQPGRREVAIANVPPAAIAAPAPAAAVPGAPSSPRPQDPDGSSIVPSVKLRLLGDAGYHATNLKGDTNSFYIGSLDMLMTGSLTDRTSILGEVLFTSTADNSFAIDVERLVLQHKTNDYFTFGVGRYHTSIGYYNPTFHRGAWFQTAIGRPFMYAFDDEGGSFPLQEIGVTTSGHLPSERLGLQYVAEIGNGRNHLLGSDPAQNHHDTNNGKSVNFALSSRPSAISGLDVGFSIYHDYVTFADNINHGEIISTVHVVYMNSTYEFLNEAALIRHTGASDGSPGTFHTPAFYTQISRKFGKYRPYFRYQYMNAGVAEPIFGDAADGSVVGRRNSASLGVRWDFNDHAAWKLQYDYLTRRGSDLVSDRTLRSGSGIATEFSFAF
jgi:hypothetical protein